MALLEKTILEATSDFELRIPMTYEQFLTELSEDVHAEWDVDHFKLGKILAAPVEMKPTATSNSREPDLLFVTKENLHRFGETKLEGAADLAVEIISPESISRDTVDKLYEYEAEGVREYWIIDTRAGEENALFYAMDDTDQYCQVKPDGDGIYESTALPNFWINTKWLWDNPQPSALEVFALIVGPDELIKTINQSQLRRDGN